MFSFCKKIFPDDNLSIQRENYSGNQLRLDGYYYRYINEEYYFPKLFFYNNGVILEIGGRFKTFEEVEEYLNRIYIENSNYNSNKLSWGVYRVENDNIKFEKWYPGSGGGFPGIVLSLGGVKNIVLVESDKKKSVFLAQAAIRKLNPG